MVEFIPGIEKRFSVGPVEYFHIPDREIRIEVYREKMFVFLDKRGVTNPLIEETIMKLSLPRSIQEASKILDCFMNQSSTSEQVAEGLYEQYRLSF